MKKRLLSAFLALAMVLTMLPATAFAANVNSKSPMLPNDSNAKWTDSAGTDHYFYVKDANDKVTNTVNVTRCSTVGTEGLEYGKWYWLDNQNKDADGNYKYYEVQSGIVAGVNGSGQWYASLDDFTNTTKNADGSDKKNVRSTSFTILGKGSIDLSGYADTSLTVDLTEGTTLTVPKGLTNLTVTGKYVNGTSATKGKVEGLTTTRSAYATTAPGNSTVTINATDVNVGAISLTGRANTVTLTGCDVTSITMDGTYVSATTPSPTNAYPGQRLTATNCTVTGAITIKGDGSTVGLTNVNGKDAGTATGALSVTGNGGTITVAGTSNLGAVTSAARDKTGQYPSVTINGGTVAGVTQTAVTDNGNSIAVNINNSGASVGTSGVTIEKGTLAIASGKVDGAVTVKAGELRVSGNGVSITGETKLGEKGDTNLNISATNSSFGKITSSGTYLKTVTWPAGRGNSYGELDLGSYAGNGVKGGKFAIANATATNFGKEANLGWFDTSLQYMAPINANQIALYGRNELATAIAETTAPAGTTYGNSAICMLGQGEGTPAALTLKNGDDEWATSIYNSPSKFILPTQINTVKVGSWIVDTADNKDGNKRSFVAGTEETIGFYSNGLVLNANPNGTSAYAEKLINATNASSSPNSGVVLNEDVTVTLNGNNINLTGAVTNTAGGVATITVELTTDVLKTGGGYETLTVDVFYDVEKKTFSFDKTSKLDFGASIDANGDLVLNNGVGAHYTVSGNLAKSAGNLYIVDQDRAEETIVGAVGGSLSSRNQAQKDLLIAAIEKDAKFSYANSPAFRQAVNAAQASITSTTTVDGWINTARTTVWRNGYKDAATDTGYVANMVPHSTTFANVSNDNTDKQKVSDAFNTAYIVPYLLITATNETQTGELTLTVQPYYRVDVSATSYDKDVYHTVQTGRPLTLSGDMGSGVELTLPLDGTTFKTVNTTAQYMHQDSKYVYKADSDKYTITHVGTNGSLGTMVLNGTEGPITLTQTTANAGLKKYGCTYDDLQAAIDDTGVETVTKGAITDKDKVTASGSYSGSCNVTMTGYARTIDVDLQGLHTLNWSGAELSVTQSDASGIYTLQLKKDTAPTGGNITIASATGGTASVSANPATVGQTVTVTLSPASGYAASGVTVRTSTGVAVSASGSGNTYTFTMPSGSVTVTPSFTASQTGATVYVGNSSTGSGTASTTAGNNKVAAGTTVTVTTTPGSGQRTMGLSVTGATATRTGVNQFQFTVPSGYTTVTVTPSFDANNGTFFSDVWSSEYYSTPVSWAVGRGITNGTSTYTFAPNNSCTREDMVTFLYRAAGSPAVGNVNNPFWDVVPGSYYYNAVMWAVSKGITNGVSANQFGVGQTVTRAQAVTFLYRYEGSPSASTSSGFYDVPTGEYYARAVSWAQSKGVTNGTSTYTFGPNEYCLRGQIVTFLYRDINNVRA